MYALASIRFLDQSFFYQHQPLLKDKGNKISELFITKLTCFYLTYLILYILNPLHSASFVCYTMPGVEIEIYMSVGKDKLVENTFDEWGQLVFYSLSSVIEVVWKMATAMSVSILQLEL